MALLRTLETNDFSFALALSMSKFLTFEATNIWVYPDVIIANANGDWNIGRVICYQKGV
jgi:hypothetical protein